MSASKRATGIPASRLTEITKGRKGLTAETALRLAKFFGASAAFWVGLQAEHDLEVDERSAGAKVDREVHPLLLASIWRGQPRGVKFKPSCQND